MKNGTRERERERQREKERERERESFDVYVSVFQICTLVTSFHPWSKFQGRPTFKFDKRPPPSNAWLSTKVNELFGRSSKSALTCRHFNLNYVQLFMTGKSKSNFCTL